MGSRPLDVPTGHLWKTGRSSRKVCNKRGCLIARTFCFCIKQRWGAVGRLDFQIRQSRFEYYWFLIILTNAPYLPYFSSKYWQACLKCIYICSGFCFPSGCGVTLVMAGFTKWTEAWPRLPFPEPGDAMGGVWALSAHSGHPDSVSLGETSPSLMASQCHRGGSGLWSGSATTPEPQPCIFMGAGFWTCRRLCHSYHGAGELISNEAH